MLQTLVANFGFKVEDSSKWVKLTYGLLLVFTSFRHSSVYSNFVFPAKASRASPCLNCCFKDGVT